MLDDMSIYKYVMPSEALVYAIMTGSVTDVRHLARLGAEIPATDAWVTYEACLYGRDMLYALSLNPAIDINPVMPGQMGDTVFHFLLRTPSSRFADEKREVIRSVIIRGIDPWKRDKLGNTALHILAGSALQDEQNGCGIMRMLFNESTRDIPLHMSSRFKTVIDAPNEHGNTPLLVAVLHNNIGCIQFLLDHGANPRIKGQFNKTPLFFACSRNYMEASELLKKHRATVD